MSVRWYPIINQSKRMILKLQEYIFCHKKDVKTYGNKLIKFMDRDNLLALKIKITKITKISDNK